MPIRLTPQELKMLLQKNKNPNQCQSNVQHPRGRMNNTEFQYCARLELQRLAGEIAGYMFEAYKLKLADRTYYTPDFMVIHTDGSIEFHEVKGFMRDDAAVKLKVAADKFCWHRFYLVRKDKQGWTIKLVNPSIHASQGKEN